MIASKCSQCPFLLCRYTQDIPIPFRHLHLLISSLSSPCPSFAHDHKPCIITTTSMSAPKDSPVTARDDGLSTAATLEDGELDVREVQGTRKPCGRSRCRKSPDELGCGRQAEIGGGMLNVAGNGREESSGGESSSLKGTWYLCHISCRDG